MGKDYFPKVREAREALREKALELYEQYIALALEARAAGKLDIAEAIYWKLLEHMPAEDGVRVIDPSAATQPKLEGPKGPQIAIGINLGTSPKALPEAKIIDITPHE